MVCYVVLWQINGLWYQDHMQTAERASKWCTEMFAVGADIAFFHLRTPRA